MLSRRSPETGQRIAELVKKTPSFLEGFQEERGALTPKKFPVGVFMPYEEFRRLECLMELLEDFTLGHLALLRSRRKSKYVRTLQEAMHRAKLE